MSEEIELIQKWLQERCESSIEREDRSRDVVLSGACLLGPAQVVVHGMTPSLLNRESFIPLTLRISAGDHSRRSSFCYGARLERGSLWQISGGVGARAAAQSKLDPLTPLNRLRYKDIEPFLNWAEVLFEPSDDGIVRRSYRTSIEARKFVKTQGKSHVSLASFEEGVSNRIERLSEMLRTGPVSFHVKLRLGGRWGPISIVHRLRAQCTRKGDSSTIGIEIYRMSLPKASPSFDASCADRDELEESIKLNSRDWALLYIQSAKSLGLHETSPFRRVDDDTFLCAWLNKSQIDAGGLEELIDDVMGSMGKCSKGPYR